MKKSFFLMIFLSFYFLSQFVQAAPYDYICDSRLNYDVSYCDECTTPNCYAKSTTLSFDKVVCPSGKVLVDCYDNPVYGDRLTHPYTYACIDLQCGDGGIVSGTTCIQDPSLDSNCLDSTTHRYGWTDNTKPWSLSPCKCYPTYVSEAERIMKKANGATCTASDGNLGECTDGKCTTAPALCTTPDTYKEKTLCENAACIWCAAPNTPKDKCVLTPSDCKSAVCKDTDTGVLSRDGDLYVNPDSKGTCTDSTGSHDDVCSGGAPALSVKEYYCASGTNNCASENIACSGSKQCIGGACVGSGGGGGTCRNGMQDGDETGVDCGGSCAACETCSGSCGYNAVDPYGNSHCISNCPISYPNQQWVCVPGLPGGCGGKSGCASYDPSKGETPCSPSCGTFYTCDRQSVCTSTGCKNICSDPSFPKDGETYCSKCDHCNDGILNCGEPAPDRCGEECKIPYDGYCTSTGYGYGSDNGVTRCANGDGGGWSCTGDATCCKSGADIFFSAQMFMHSPSNFAHMLSHNELIALIKGKPPLVEQMIDPDIQVQPNGVEMTLQRVESHENSGAIAFDNSQRKLPQTKNLDFDKDGWLHLPKGSYKIVFNEIVNIPKNIAAIAKPRSSLLRCGVTVETAVWDAGYSGRSESLLVVYNEKGFMIKKDARVLQLLFFRLGEEVMKGYSGVYQNENVRAGK